MSEKISACRLCKMGMGTSANTWWAFDARKQGYTMVHYDHVRLVESLGDACVMSCMNYPRPILCEALSVCGDDISRAKSWLEQKLAKENEGKTIQQLLDRKSFKEALQDCGYRLNHELLLMKFFVAWNEGDYGQKYPSLLKRDCEHGKQLYAWILDQLECTKLKSAKREADFAAELERVMKQTGLLTSILLLEAQTSLHRGGVEPLEAGSS